MKISIPVLYFGLLFCFSCQNSSSSRKSSNSSDSLSISKEVALSDTTIIVDGKTDTTIGILNIENKIRDKKKLVDLDYIAIDVFLRVNNDESKFEEFGYTLFEYLKKNKSNNTSFVNFLRKKEKKYREVFLNRLIKVMCIDIGEENYSYENFIKDFELFKNSEAAKKSLKDCIGNDIQ